MSQGAVSLAFSTASLPDALGRQQAPALSLDDALLALDEIRCALLAGDNSRAERALEALDPARLSPATLDALSKAGAVAVALSATRTFGRSSEFAASHCGSLLVCVGISVPQQAAVITDGVVDLLRTELTESSDPVRHMTVASRCVCAFVLTSLMGHCDDGDAAVPGTYALRAGALVLLEAASALVPAKTSFRSTMESAVRKLRGVEAESLKTDANVRLKRAEAANDTAALIALVRESIERSDAELAARTLNALRDVMYDADDDVEYLLEEYVDELLAAGGLATLVKAVEAFGRTHAIVLYSVGRLLNLFRSIEVPRIVASSRAVLNFAMDAPPAAVDDKNGDAFLQLAGLAAVLTVAETGLDAALRAKALDARVVERLITISSMSGDGRFMPGLPFYFLGLTVLCGPLNAVPDACALRVITAGGVGLAIAAMRARDAGYENQEAESAAFLMMRLQQLALAMKAPDEAVVSIFRMSERKMFEALRGALTQLAHANILWALKMLNALPCLAKAVGGGRCSPACAAATTDAVVATLRKMLPENATFAELAGAFAGALRAFAGGCGGDDASAPGTHALRAGALPLLESMQPAVERALTGSYLDKAARKQLGAVADFVRTLRALEASREASALRAAAALLAEEEAELARRSKGGKKVKACKSKAAPVAAAAAAVEQVTAFAAISIADVAAIMAPAESQAAETEPPAPPQPDAALAALPPLPPWLLQAMLAPPPQPTPPIAPPLQPLAAPPPAMPPGPQGVPLPATQAVPLSSLVQQPRWEVPPPPKAPAGAWGRRPPAIPGMALSRESECAICLDAVAVGRTPCCGQTAFCAPCTATLRAECPLCRALPPSATS
jgi:hypothetical protein